MFSQIRNNAFLNCFSKNNEENGVYLHFYLSGNKRKCHCKEHSPSSATRGLDTEKNIPLPLL